MKKYFAIILLITIALTIFGCNSVKKETIIDSWRKEGVMAIGSTTVMDTLTFYEDGTVMELVITIPVMSTYAERSGTWKIKGNTVILTINNSDGQLTERLIYSEDKLVSEDGNIRFIRMGE